MIKMRKKKKIILRFYHGVDEKGRRFIILKYKGRFLIFGKTSKLLKFLQKHIDEGLEDAIEKAVEYVDKVFRNREEEYAKRILKKLMKEKPRYIG
ncbi:MAG: hypothetical protein DRJ31_03150 [Candidatus Methanomethylicota archaeon]|uniref:Uncharacterized protein n=1 Tax=Thermoproteota archaeon TaxID=2056631 RepID=A0A497ETH6_9CREN|nr:MAG: hypothetical protein DRJ31_03150 [Candidatus Verstraetearchaeota archaeon]